MTSPLNQILAKEHVADLMADADRHRARGALAPKPQPVRVAAMLRRVRLSGRLRARSPSIEQ
jgi:hypothetical protein